MKICINFIHILFRNVELCTQGNYCLEVVVLRCSVKKGVLRNFERFTGKHLCPSLFFNNVVTLLKKRLRHRCLPVNFVKFLRTPFLLNSSPLKISFSKMHFFREKQLIMLQSLFLYHFLAHFKLQCYRLVF